MGMSGSTYRSRHNEITKGYYFFLIGEINRGNSKADVYTRIQQDGQTIYFLN
jgi:hypothetical protein